MLSLYWATLVGLYILYLSCYISLSSFTGHTTVWLEPRQTATNNKHKPGGINMNVKHVVLVPPAFGTVHLLEPLTKYLESHGCQVHLVRYDGHFGDDADVARHTLNTYYHNTLRTIERVETEIGTGAGSLHNNGLVHLLGISQGAILAHRCAQSNPARFSGVTMYGAPQMGRLPVWKTLFMILTNSQYRKPILSKSGKVYLAKKHVEDLLFGGYNHHLVEEISRTPAGGQVLSEILLGQMTPNQYSLSYAVISAGAEKFHRNSAAKTWSRKSRDCKHFTVQGSHFGSLFHTELHECIWTSIHDAFNILEQKKRDIEEKRRNTEIAGEKITTLLPCAAVPGQSSLSVEF
jgi:thioesterase domain-containing protein